jgi:orotidine-5'-phosphate decarboxylase
MSSPLAKDRIVFPLDVDTHDRAIEWARLLKNDVGLVKVGLELFLSEGPQIVVSLRQYGARIFLDLKLHDIPNTVRQAALVAGRLGVELLTVHASGGPAMVAAACEGAAQGAREVRLPAPAVLAVTVLTSISDAELEAVGMRGPCEEAALRLGKLAISAGAQGLVCSPKEVGLLRAAVGSSPLLVVPGIRPASSETHDQARTDTPAKAIREGASLLVIGRPIREASDPVARAREIAAEIEPFLRPSLAN